MEAEFLKMKLLTLHPNKNLFNEQERVGNFTNSFQNEYDAELYDILLKSVTANSDFYVRKHNWNSWISSFLVIETQYEKGSNSSFFPIFLSNSLYDPYSLCKEINAGIEKYFILQNCLEFEFKNNLIVVNVKKIWTKEFILHLDPNLYDILNFDSGYSSDIKIENIANFKSYTSFDEPEIKKVKSFKYEKGNKILVHSSTPIQWKEKANFLKIGFNKSNFSSSLSILENQPFTFVNCLDFKLVNYPFSIAKNFDEISLNIVNEDEREIVLDNENPVLQILFSLIPKMSPSEYNVFMTFSSENNPFMFINELPKTNIKFRSMTKYKIAVHSIHFPKYMLDKVENAVSLKIGTNITPNHVYGGYMENYIANIPLCKFKKTGSYLSYYEKNPLFFEIVLESVGSFFTTLWFVNENEYDNVKIGEDEKKIKCHICYILKMIK